MNSTAPNRSASELASRSGTDAILTARGIRKSFQIADRELEILHGVDIDLARGELCALMGASGAGKSTLIQILGVLDEPTSGSVVLDGIEAWSLPTNERARLRNSKIGFVFQFYHLLPELTAIENVLLPAMIAWKGGEYRARASESLEKARALLERFGLADRMQHRPAQLSGGERQRVAIARALFLDPTLVIADEPTGNLDSATGEKVLELLLREQEERRVSLLLVTHDERLARRCQRVVRMADGRVAPSIAAT